MHYPAEIHYQLINTVFVVVNMGVLHAHMSVYHLLVWCLWRSEEDINKKFSYTLLVSILK